METSYVIILYWTYSVLYSFMFHHKFFLTFIIKYAVGSFHLINHWYFLKEILNVLFVVYDSSVKLGPLKVLVKLFTGRKKHKFKLHKKSNVLWPWLTQRLIDENRVYHCVHNNAICCVLCFMTYTVICFASWWIFWRAKINFECI